MKSFSSVKGDPGAPTGFTRWHRQYSGKSNAVFCQPGTIIATENY